MSLPDLSQLEYAFLISQVFAGCALVSDFMSFQMKKKEVLLFFLILSTALLAIHFAFLDRWAGTAMMILAGIKFLVARKTHHYGAMIFFMFATAVGTMLTFKDTADLLILVGGMLVTLAAFQEHDKPLRLIMMVGTLFFIAYNTVVFSPVGVLVEISFLMSNLLGYYRHYLRTT